MKRPRARVWRVSPYSLRKHDPGGAGLISINIWNILLLALIAAQGRGQVTECRVRGDFIGGIERQPKAPSPAATYCGRKSLSHL